MRPLGEPARPREIADADGSCGDALYGMALAGGARACGFATGALAPGLRADLIALGDDESAGPFDDGVLDRYVFAAIGARPARVMTRGRWRSDG